MSEIALTRRAVASDDTLRRAVALLRRTDFDARVRRSLPVLALTCAASALVVLGLDLPDDLVPALAIGLVAGLAIVAYETARVTVRFRRGMRADLAPGAVMEAGYARGVLRLRGSEDDAITLISSVRIHEAGDLVLLSGSLLTVVTRDLLTDDDLRLLREPAAPALPRRPGADVPLTREFFADERWSRRCGRAWVAWAHRSVLWWAGVLGWPALAAGLAFLRNDALLAAGLTYVIVTSAMFGWLTWHAHRSGVRGSNTPPHGFLWASGFSHDALRILGPEADVRAELSAVTGVRALRDVVFLSVSGGRPVALPRELVGDGDLARVEATVAGRR